MVVEVRGIEPLFWEPKSHVLPLDDTSITLLLLEPRVNESLDSGNIVHSVG